MPQNKVPKWIKKGKRAYVLIETDTNRLYLEKIMEEYPVKYEWKSLFIRHQPKGVFALYGWGRKKLPAPWKVGL